MYVVANERFPFSFTAEQHFIVGSYFKDCRVIYENCQVPCLPYSRLIIISAEEFLSIQQNFLPLKIYSVLGYWHICIIFIYLYYSYIYFIYNETKDTVLHCIYGWYTKLINHINYIMIGQSHHLLNDFKILLKCSESILQVTSVKTQYVIPVAQTQSYYIALFSLFD